MSACPYGAGKAPCGELEAICTVDESKFCLLREKERKTTIASCCKTVKGDFGQSTELIIESPSPSSRILLTSIHASYNVDGTNGLLQVFMGDKGEAIWGARTMGMHLTINFPYPIVSGEGEKILLQLANKAGVQGHLSVTWLIEE